jgi:hypothetical protein
MLHCSKTNRQTILSGDIAMKEQINPWAEATKKSLSAARELGDMQLNLLTSLNRQQWDVVDIYTEAGSKQAELLVKAKSLKAEDVKAVFAAQPTLAEEMGKKLMNNAYVTSSMVSEAATQGLKWSMEWQAKMLEMAHAATPKAA